MYAKVMVYNIHIVENFIIKVRVFGEVRCHMYSVEWQKRGLPHADILIWLVNKITPVYT